MILETKSTRQLSDTKIVINIQVTLTEKESNTYRLLDTILRNNSNNENILDLVSDYGFSYSNDVLSTLYWDRLEDLLKSVQTELNR